MLGGVPGSGLSEFLSAYCLWVNENSPSFSQNSPSLPQNSVRLSEFSPPKQYSRNSIPPVSYFGGRFGYFYFFLLGEGEGGVRGARRGGVGFLLKIPGGEGFQPDRRGRGFPGPLGSFETIFRI